MRKTDIKVTKYVVLILSAVALVFIYGLVIGGNTGVLFCCLEFAVSVALLFFFVVKAEKEKLQLGRVLFIAAVVVVFSVWLYGEINRMTGTVLTEFESKITDMHNGRGEFYSTVSFNDPDGNEQQARANYGSIIADDDFIDTGDIVRIEKVKGFFGAEFHKIK